ncbi:phospholysine phosphohistidine inorganic pyrophosphate phosphatase-like [Hetaerina americana]|uniref:phospholysine phosphohistidine inorganic pyrophosphate phosphatase-like n=1 Tax=Hetaerina americana TaxID=62018 RepID=UPI003A7F4BA8
MPSWIRCIRGVMLDISGVLKNGDVAISGSVEAVKRLRDAGLTVRFVTNETQLTRRMLLEKLLNIGFQLTENEIFSPAPVMVNLLNEKTLRPMLLVHPKVLPEFIGIDQSSPNCVVIGDAVDFFTYERLNDAFKLLMTQKGAPLFTLGRGRYYKEEDGLCMDVGGFTAALEYASGVQAEVVGKPAKTFFATALNDMGLDVSEVLMVGDDIVSDVGGAQKFGLKGVLVRTGKFIPEKDENHPIVKPDAIVDDLAQGVDMILSGQAEEKISGNI